MTPHAPSTAPATVVQALARLSRDGERGFRFRALDGQEHSYPWRALELEATRRAQLLFDLASRKGDRAALVLAESHELVLTFLTLDHAREHAARRRRSARGRHDARAGRRDGRADGCVASELRKTIATRVVEACGVAPSRVCVVRVGSLPTTSSGKIQRRRTRELYERDLLELHPE